MGRPESVTRARFDDFKYLKIFKGIRVTYKARIKFTNHLFTKARAQGADSRGRAL